MVKIFIGYSTELQNTIKYLKWYRKISHYNILEKEMSQQFKNNNYIAKGLRQNGNLKKSFNYFLIDSRISKDLPRKSMLVIKEHLIWKQFLRSIFYVGKGKNERPYLHFYAASKIHQLLKDGEKNMFLDENFSTNSSILEDSEKMPSNCIIKSPNCNDNLLINKTLLRILDIWSSQNGVLCLHAFHNILPAEAYTREAAMIDAIGLSHLTNKRHGKYYGAPSEWSRKKRKLLGINFLFKAMKIFLADGETFLYAEDFDQKNRSSEAD